MSCTVSEKGEHKSKQQSLIHQLRILKNLFDIMDNSLIGLCVNMDMSAHFQCSAMLLFIREGDISTPVGITSLLRLNPGRTVEKTVRGEEQTQLS